MSLLKNSAYKEPLQHRSSGNNNVEILLRNSAIHPHERLVAFQPHSKTKKNKKTFNNNNNVRVMNYKVMYCDHVVFQHYNLISVSDIKSQNSALSKYCHS